MSKHDKPEPPPELAPVTKPFPPPSSEPGAPPTLDPAQIEALLAGLPQDQLMEILAKASALAKHLDGDDARAYVETVTAQLQTLAREVGVDDQMQATRSAAATEIGNLLDAVQGVPAGQALAQHRDRIVGAFAHADLAKIDEGLKLIASYIQNPSEDTKQRAQVLLAELEKTFGPLVVHDTEREDRERRERIRSEVKETVSQIFAQLPKPKIEFKPTTKLPGAEGGGDDDGDQKK